MPILWHGVQRSTKPGDLTAPKKWYVQWVQRSVQETDELAEMISEQTTISPTDVKAVLDALQPNIIRALTHSDSVNLKGICSFLISVTGSEGADTEDDLNKVKKEADVYIRVSREIQEALDKADFQRE